MLLLTRLDSRNIEQGKYGRNGRKQNKLLFCKNTYVRQLERKCFCFFLDG